MIDLSMSENANLLHGRDYSLHVSQKLGAKIDTQSCQGETWRDCVSSMQSTNAV